MNKLLLYSLSLFFLTQATEITKQEGCFVSQKKLDSAQLFKTNIGYEKLKDNECFKVHDHYNVVLHKSNCENSNTFEDYDPIQMSQLSNTLMAKANLNGSDSRKTAAGFWLSKLAVHVAAQAVYALAAGAASLIYPSAAPVVYCSLQLTFATPVEIISNIVASGTTRVSDDTIDHE
jgi:hypothetical protein